MTSRSRGRGVRLRECVTNLRDVIYGWSLAADAPSLGRHAAGDVAEGVAVVEGAQDDALLLRAPVQLAPRLSLVQGKKEQCIQG